MALYFDLTYAEIGGPNFGKPMEQDADSIPRGGRQHPCQDPDQPVHRERAQTDVPRLPLMPCVPGRPQRPRPKPRVPTGASTDPTCRLL
jgi:hypothetical protein